jgi:hypothetical protein
MPRYRQRSLGEQRGERGADIFEAALVLPLVLTILFAMYSFGRGWDVYQTMTRAAREGVRQTVTTDCAMCADGGMEYQSPTYIQDNVVFPALQAAGLNTSNSVLVNSYHQGITTLDTAGKVCGAYITFSYPYQLQLPFLSTTISTITLTTRVQMRLESQPSTCTPS